ncbi:MAG: radical SAM protein [Deltaproteobacteria bacterium]|nr:radical SAM protein [Deltaproteobacteria bacterium]
MKPVNVTPGLKRRLHPVHRFVETAFHSLRYLFLEITARCNLNCRHCGSDCQKNESPNSLSVAQWQKVIDDIAATFEPSSVFLVVTGGEPLCHPRLSQILRQIRKHGFSFGLVSNGYSLTEEKLNALLQLKMASMTISLDGMQRQHDWLRGRNGSFQRAVAAIEMLAQSNIPIFDVVTCAHPGMLAQLPRIESLLRDKGVSRWRLFSIFPKGRARINDNLILNPSQLRFLLSYIANRRRELKNAPFQLDFCCEGFLPTALDFKVRTEPYFCRAGINIGSILNDGAISACPNISRTLVQGNVITDDFKSVWENRFQKFRERSWLKIGPCAKCKYWSGCQGNSMHLYDEKMGHTCVCHAAVATESRRFFIR